MPGRSRADTNQVTPTLLGVSIILLVCAVAVIVALARRPAGGLSLPAGYHVVHVTEREFSVQSDQTTLPAGNTLFVVTNAGTIPHEFVLFLTKNPAAQLPLDGSDVNEDAPSLENIVDSGTSLGRGDTRLISATLQPGHYAMICNLPGHYRNGMHQDVTVSGPPPGAARDTDATQP